MFPDLNGSLTYCNRTYEFPEFGNLRRQMIHKLVCRRRLEHVLGGIAYYVADITPILTTIAIIAEDAINKLRSALDRSPVR
jgi:hypothetical protein